MQTNLQASIVNGLRFKLETSQPTAPEETGDASPLNQEILTLLSNQ